MKPLGFSPKAAVDLDAIADYELPDEIRIERVRHGVRDLLRMFKE